MHGVTRTDGAGFAVEMTKILVVDDNAANRKVVLTLLQHEGYKTFEAADGADGLRAAIKERPQLVISDIVMPSMDGYEFVRQLRADPQLAPTTVIFYTANYHNLEAKHLAEQCGVARVIVKPCGAREFLKTVAEVLSGVAGAVAPRIEPEFDRQHLQVLTDTLSKKADQLSALNDRFAALTELNVQLASERNPWLLLDRVCAGARSLLGAKFGVLAVAERIDSETLRVWTSGLGAHGVAVRELTLSSGLPAQAYKLSRSIRTRTQGEPLDLGLPPNFPPATSALIVPINSLTRTYGWLCLADKLGCEEFDADDERMLATLGAQVGRIYENGNLYLEVRQQATRLLEEMAERERATAKIVQLSRVHAMLSGINSLIVRVSDRNELFDEACRLAVQEGRFPVAWCAMLDPETRQLNVVASRGELPPIPELLSPQADDRDEPNPVLAALRSQSAQICNNLQTQAQVLPGHDLLVERGFGGLAVFPLTIGGNSVGCLVLITGEAEVFDAAETRLLMELAGDISFALDHIEKSERLTYLAYYDALTGLANATFFAERLAIQVSTAARNGSRFALVVVGPERLEGYNDALEPGTGDELIRTLAGRFVDCVGTSSVVARIGSDQFAAFIPELRSDYALESALKRWWREWPGPALEIGGHEITVAAKAGIALYPTDGADAETLLRNAQTALKKARNSSSRHVFYTSSLSERIAERLTLENQIRRGLENEEFVLHYQPKVDLLNRRVTGVEALMRWQHPELGLVPPSKFIPIMEETGLIVEAGTWALRQACADRSRWLERYRNAPRVAVNVSAIQLRHDDFVRTVTTILGLAGAEAGIDIEVTESLLMENMAENIQKLAAIRGHGVQIALDDFGTGYSSLSYLAKLPVETLKIDRAFIVTMLDDPSATAVVSTIISLARALKLETVAEGVETEDQAKILRLLQCDQMQGFLISKPLTAEDMMTFLGRSKPMIAAVR